MRTLYYYVRWLIKDIEFKFDSMYIVFIASICFVTGIFMNVAGMMIHTKIDPTTGHLVVFKDEYWPVLGDKFLMAGMILYIIFVFWQLVVKNIQSSFRRFKQEQHDLLFKIDNSDKRGSR
mgnify:FL=1